MDCLFLKTKREMAFQPFNSNQYFPTCATSSFPSAPFFFLFVSLFSANAQPVIDGDMSDPHYIFLAKKDTNYNSFPNSELGAMYYYTFFDTLYIGITGELDIIPFPPGTPSYSTPEDPSNIVLFFDWSDYAGRGSQELDPQRIGASGVFIPWGGLNKTRMDFDADFAMAFNTGINDEVIVMDAVRYGPDSLNPILASNTFGPDVIQLTGNTAVHPINTVFGGSSGATITYAYQNGYSSSNQSWKGLEMKIPFNAFQDVTSSSGLCVFAALTDKTGYFSNEVLPGNPLSSTHLGDTVDFTSYANQDFCAPIFQILPVELVNFDGLQKNGKTWLSWATASELNSKAFHIERRYPLTSWETIGEVEAKGNSSGFQRYEFIDANPGALRTLYRLRQVDLDGTIHYSQSISIENRFGTKLDFMVYPNPAKDVVWVYTGSPLPAGSRVQVLDLSGKRLLDIEVEEGTREIRLDLGPVNTGLHLVRIQAQGLVEHRKLVVK